MNSIQLKERINQLAPLASLLQPDFNTRKKQLSAISDYTEQFISSITNGKVVDFETRLNVDTESFQYSEAGIELIEALNQFDNEIVSPGLTTASSRFFGFIPGGGLFSGALGDYLAALTNKYAGNSFASPGASMCERSLVKWFANEVGYPDTAQGDLTSGGSIANLSAIVTAREVAGLKGRDFDRCVVYMTSITHHCVKKALKIAGMGDCTIRVIPVDDDYRMDPDELLLCIKNDKKEGLNPWFIVANGGTTDLGSIDPLEAISHIAQSENIWFHVDGAYGAAFVLCKAGKQRLAGIEQSDSMIVDPHKGLFLSYGTGMLIVADGANLFNTYQESAPYMQDLDTVNMTDNLPSSDLSPELSRHFRGMRLWLSLKLNGVAAFRAALEEKLLLAEYFHNRLAEIDGFDMGPYPQLSVAGFRYVPKSGDANKFNQRLRDELQQEGDIFLSSSTIKDYFILRFAVLSYDTHIDDVDFAIERILAKVDEIEKS